MSVLQVTKMLPDGRTVEFHVPVEFHLDMATHHMQIIVESFPTEPDARTRSMSSAKSVVDVPLPAWDPVYANNLINFVTSDPAWAGAVVLP